MSNMNWNELYRRMSTQWGQDWIRQYANNVEELRASEILIYGIDLGYDNWMELITKRYLTFSRRNAFGYRCFLIKRQDTDNKKEFRTRITIHFFENAEMHISEN